MAPTTRFYIGMAMGALVLFGTGSALAQSRCESTQLKSVGKYGYCAAKAMYKALKTGDNSYSLSRCTPKLEGDFQKADERYAYDCHTPTGDFQTLADDAMADADSCMGDVLDGMGGLEPPAQYESCKASEMKEAGKFYYCIAKARSKATKRGQPADYLKCEIKFRSSIFKARSRSGCDDADLDPMAADPIDAYARSLQSDIEGCFGPTAAWLHGHTPQSATAVTSCTYTVDGSSTELFDVEVAMTVTPLTPFEYVSQVPPHELRASAVIDSVTIPGVHSNMESVITAADAKVYAMGDAFGHQDVLGPIGDGYPVTDPWTIPDWGPSVVKFGLNSGASTVSFEVRDLRVEFWGFGILRQLDCQVAQPVLDYDVY